MNKKIYPPAVVLGMTATGLSVARSLGRKGIKVYGLESNRCEPGIFSRYVTPVIVPNALENEREFIDYLVDFGKKLPQQGILMCTSDEYLIAVSKNRETLSVYFKFNLPSRETVDNFSDKRKSYDIARTHGILCPATYCLNDIEEVRAIAKRIQYPCALKPALSHLWRIKHGGKKLIVVDSPEELIARFSGIAKECPGIMIQELISGGDDRIQTFYGYYDSKGELLALCMKRKLRQHPIHFGIASFCVSEANDLIKTMGLGFLEKIKYTGFGGMEFKRDAGDGKFRFTELNMRFVMPGEVLVASGVDFPYIMYRDLIGEKVEKILTFKEGVKLVNLELDLGSFWQYLKAKEITLWQYLSSFIGGRLAHTYFAWNDLRPGLFVFHRFVKNLFKKFLPAIKIKDFYQRLHLPIRQATKQVYSFVPLRIRNGDRFFKELEFLNKSQYWSRQELENYQNEKLRKLIEHVYENIPYYRGLFKENRLMPSDIKTIHDLPKLPVLTKDIVRENWRKMIAVNFRPGQLKLIHTSGTTGEPLHFYSDRRNEYLTGAPVQWRYFGWGGRSFKDVTAVFDCRAIKPSFSGKRRLFEYDPVTKCLSMSMNDMNRDNVREYVAAVGKYRPVFLKGYPSAVEIFLSLLKRGNIKLRTNFKAVFTNSEILYPTQRAFFEEFFGCKILDWYALQERVLAAAECGNKAGYHIFPEYGIIEFSDKKYFDNN